MIDFLIHYDNKTVNPTEHEAVSAVAEKDARGFSLGGNTDEILFPSTNQVLTVGKMAAFLNHLNPLIDYRYYDVEDRFELVSAFLRSGAARKDSIYTSWNFIEGARHKSLGKFESDDEFIKHMFAKDNMEWLYQTIKWEEARTAFLDGFYKADGYYFKKEW